MIKTQKIVQQTKPVSTKNTTYGIRTMHEYNLVYTYVSMLEKQGLANKSVYVKLDHLKEGVTKYMATKREVNKLGRTTKSINKEYKVIEKEHEKAPTKETSETLGKLQSEMDKLKVELETLKAELTRLQVENQTLICKIAELESKQVRKKGKDSDTNEKIATLILDGMTNRKIVEVLKEQGLEVSKSTVQNRRTLLRDQGLL